MDDPKDPFKNTPLPLQGPHWHRTSHQEQSFFPLRLVLQPGELHVELTRPDMIVGRHSTADLRLQLPDISRKHCRFVFKEGCWQVFDLNSLNGIFLNGEKVTQAVLADKDLLQIGGLTFEIQKVFIGAQESALAGSSLRKEAS